MVLVSDIVDSVRETVQLKTTEISDIRILYFLNRKYKNIWGQITQLDKNKKLKQRQTTINSGQSKYDLQPVGPTTFGQKKIERVEIKYKGNYYLAEQRDRGVLVGAVENYEKMQSPYNPFFIITDNAIQVFPTPKDTVVNGLVMYSSQKPYDLTLGMNETNILIDEEHLELLEYTTIEGIARQRQRVDISQEYENKYNRERERVRKDIVINATKSVVGKIPHNHISNNTYRL